MTIERQQEDLEIWRQWKKDHRNSTLNKLMTRLNPLIHREVNKWQYTVPPAALMSKGRILTAKALENYDPKRGAAIGTHVTSQLRKLSRFAYPMQNVARMPENKQLLFNTFERAKSQLYDELGREPTLEEMSDELAWPTRKVRDFQRSFGRRELVESEGAFQEDLGDETPLVDFYYHGLSPEDKLLFEDITGYGGHVSLDNAALRRKYRLTQGQLSYKKRKFTEQIRDIQAGKI